MFDLTHFVFLIKVGDAIPDVELFEGAPNQKVNLSELCKEGKTIIFGVPGAFTPGCSKTHLPGLLLYEFKLQRISVE
jgi:2-Cys peroxiredoxin 5